MIKLVDTTHRAVIKQNSFWGACMIWITFIVAIWLDFLPLPLWMESLWPLWIILVLIFWAVYLPIKVSPWMVWCLGIFYDLLQNTWLGVHAIAFILIYFLALKMSRPIKSCPLWEQMARLFILFIIYQISIFFLQPMMWREMGGLILPLLTSLLLWPWVFFLLRGIAVKFYIHYL